MIKTIMIEDQPIEINSSLGWLFCYREQFGHDILPDLLPLLEAAAGAMADLYSEDGTITKIDDETIGKVIMALSTMEILTIINVLWAMAKNAGEKRTPIEFANAFDPFPLETVTPELFWTVVRSCSSSKNLQSLLNRIPMEKLPSALQPSWWQEQAAD